ncbi:hypothetical protein HPP92_020660 [Vanilla planifolia]|uniref:Uncharacterized protein n=1 Tax=Vanilla planifolia TaxID=51239 RepID=A0A835PYH0_VANPL|nr:hypothetical protein HPP92_027422 [Vanilla planifolia]KAG0462184.1 hypothetical protein HPP92_020660 [Vanilla planifolia]
MASRFTSLASASSNSAYTSPCRKVKRRRSRRAEPLSRLLTITVGTHPKTSCLCHFEGLVNFKAATCLYAALQDEVLGTLLLNYCYRKVPAGFTCA